MLPYRPGLICYDFRLHMFSLGFWQLTETQRANNFRLVINGDQQARPATRRRRRFTLDRSLRRTFENKEIVTTDISVPQAASKLIGLLNKHSGRKGR